MMGQRTAAKMRVDTHISRCPAQALPFAVRDMLFRLGITILLRHPEVYHMYEIRVLRSRSTDEEIVRFDIPVNQVLFVDRLDTRDLPAKEAGENEIRSAENEGM